jgi:hypothetical protein
MTPFLVMLALGSYFAGITKLKDWPLAGYIMTFPARFMWVELCSSAWPGPHGVLMGCGLGLLMSFENNKLWMIGVAMILLAQQWPHV